jgi:hypothetical protein
MTASIQLAVNNEPEFLNDAEILGTETAGLDEFLSREASFLVGEMWGARDRRNTQDGDWKRTAMPWGVWIGGAAGNANAPAWGFSRHPVGKDKAGACIVLGSSVGGARKAKAMDTMYAMGLDIDSGAKVNDVLDIVEAKGLLCFVYTSYNHGKRGIELKRDEVLRKLQITRDPDISEVRKFLREFDKNRYEETFIAECTIREQKHQTSEGVKIILDTPPLEKFRLIFPLETPVKLIDLADTQQAALDLWEDKITGLARNVLGVHFDTSCTDPSRLFYTARHPKGNDDWYAAVVMGNPLSFDSIEAFKKSLYTSNREVNAFTMAGGDDGDDRPPMALTPSGKSLNEWHRSAKDRFMLADLMETLCPDKVRVAGGEVQGHVHTECPFEHEHSSEGGTATMAMNALDSQTGYWTWFCHHDACQGRHKLQYLEEALRAGWFEESVLTDLDAGFLLSVSDDEIDPFEQEEVHKEQATDFVTRAESLRDEVLEVDIEALIAEAFAADVDRAVRGRMTAAIAKTTGLNTEQVRGIWAKMDRKAKDDAQKELAEARRRYAPSPYIHLEEATVATVERAAEIAGWVPSFVTYKAGWFWGVDFDKPDAGHQRICRAFEVPHVAFGETEEGRTNEITIRYRHRSAQRGIVESTYRIGDTYRDTGSFVSRLVDEGFETDPQVKTEMLVKLLRAVNTDNEAVLVEKAGWHGDAYVSPTGVVTGGSVRYILNPKARVSGRTAGNLDDHHRYATTALTGVNGQLLLPGYLSGLVGCLVDFIENDVSPVVAMEGDSTTGKTTAGKMGAAHFAPPDNTGLFMKADQTATATENYAERANGAVLVLDEEGSSKLDAGEKQRLILQWADGSGRGRGTRDAGVQRTRTWRTCFVTSAERGFLNRLTAEGADPLTGAVARVFSVNFDGAHKLEDGSDELVAVRALSGDDRDAAIYGVTGPVFAGKLAELGRDVVRSRVSGVADEWADLARGAARRVVRLAALFCVAGEIAQEARLFGVEVPVKEHMRALLEATLDARMTHLDTDRQQLDALRRAIRRGVQTGDIVSMHDPEDYNRKERLGYYGHLAENGKPDDATNKQLRDPEAEMLGRTYILPLDRLGKLGITTGHRALADRLRDAEGLVERSKGKDRLQWYHEYVPGEGGGIRNIRVTGEFVHG